MMIRKMLIVMCLCTLPLWAEYGSESSVEVGGTVSISSIANNDNADTRYGQFVFRPHFNWFLVDNVYVGPRFHIEAVGGSSFWGAGASGGYAFTGDMPVIPYGEGGLEFIYSSYIGGEGGLAVPLRGGIKIPVFKHLLVDVQLGSYIKFINDNPGADFSVSSGIAGTFSFK
ncbi:MAG: hypothetical protein ACQEQV_10940 [Fibrobacterota bacterium]